MQDSTYDDYTNTYLYLIDSFLVEFLNAVNLYKCVNI